MPAPSTRFAELDAIRGLAIALMALDHASFFTNASLTAERYVGHPLTLHDWPRWSMGLVTNLATPLFWLISGISLSLLERRSGTARRPESLTHFMLVRAAVLLMLDVVLVPWVWSGTPGWHYEYSFDILSSLAISLVLLAVLRKLPRAAMAAVVAAVLIGFQWMATAAHGRGFYYDMWLGFNRGPLPHVVFPVLGWFGLMGFGYLFGGWLAGRGEGRARTWLVGGLTLLAVWFVLRITGGYGEFAPWHPGDPWLEFLIMTKGPPSLAFLTFNVGVGMIAGSGLIALRDRLATAPLSWLVDLGRASLFVYVLHLFVYRILGDIAFRLMHGHAIVLRIPLVALSGFIVLLPLARLYRKFKQRYPTSVLRYI